MPRFPNLLLPVLLFICLLLGSCTAHRYYAPNGHQVPMLREKGSAKISANVSAGRDYGGFELQGAYAFSPKFAAVTNHIWGAGQATSTTFGVGVSTTLSEGEGYYGEYGLGYYKALSETFTFEGYGGWGFGSIDNYYQGGGYSEVDFHKTYLQPAIGYNTGWAELIFSYRLAFLQYTKLRHSTIVSDQYVEALDYISNNSQVFLSEYAFTVRALFNSAKLHLQIGRSISINKPDLYFDDLNVNVGLTLEIDHLWNKEKRSQRIF